MQYTDVFGFKKPEYAEEADVVDLNDNMDDIDDTLYKIRRLSGLVYDATTTSSNPYVEGKYTINPTDGLMYRCTDTTYGAWDSTKWTRTDEFSEIELAMQSGSEVVANPSGTPTATMTTVEIDGVVYDIPGSGGGGVSFDEDILLNTQTTVSSGSSIQLTNNIFDYDLIIIDTSAGSYTDWREHIFIDVSQITLNTEYTRMILRDSSSTYGLRYKFTANDTIYAWGDGSRAMIIYKIAAVKFNGGGSGSGYSETSLWTGPETPSTSGTTITLNDNLSDYDMIYVNAHHGAYTNEEGSILIAVSSLTVGGSYIYTIYDYDKLYICFEYSSNTQLLIKTANSNNPITYTEIVGIKFGSGGGSGSHNYSTTEQVIGTWIDGKDVYEKTYVFNSLPSVNDWTAFDVDCGIDTLVDYSLMFTRSNGQIDNDSDEIRVAYNPPNSLGDLCYYPGGVGATHITVRYTKTASNN